MTRLWYLVLCCKASWLEVAGAGRQGFGGATVGHAKKKAQAHPVLTALHTEVAACPGPTCAGRQCTHLSVLSEAGIHG